MKGRREAGSIRLGRDGLQLYEQSGYGRPGGDGLSLVPVEALYLVHRGRLELPGETFESLLAEFTADPHFLRTYLVYRDLRERGYVVQTGPHDFRVFRRGQRPGSGQSQYMVRVLSERDPIAFDRVIAEATSTARMRKSHLLAVVDDEDELTYYEVKLPTLPQRDATVPARTVTARPFGWAVIAYGEEGAALEAGGYGTRIDDRRLKLAPVEAVYLIENGGSASSTARWRRRTTAPSSRGSTARPARRVQSTPTFATGDTTRGPGTSSATTTASTARQRPTPRCWSTRFPVARPCPCRSSRARSGWPIR